MSADRIVIDVDRDGLTGGLQLNIAKVDEDGKGFGHRLAGPKYVGASENLLSREINRYDADAIREYLDAVFPPKPATRELTLSRLTTELRDFMGLAEDLDLPKVDRIDCAFNADDAEPRWVCEAQVNHPATDSGAGFEALSGWARYVGGQIEAGEAYKSGVFASRLQRQLTLRVVVAGVSVELYALVDGLFEIPAAQAAEAVAR